MGKEEEVEEERTEGQENLRGVRKGRVFPLALFLPQACPSWPFYGFPVCLQLKVCSVPGSPGLQSLLSHITPGSPQVTNLLKNP